MHAYATDSDERKKIIAMLALASAAIAGGLTKWATYLPLALTIPSPMVIFGLLYAAFDKAVWKWAPLRRIGAVRVPNLAGDWEGMLWSSHDSFETPHPISVQVEQTWSRICVRLKTAHSGSHSVAAALHTEAPSGTCLIYVYRNEPTAFAVDPLHAHGGTAVLELTRDGRLEGDYYSGRSRKNHGRMSLRPINLPRKTEN